MARRNGRFSQEAQSLPESHSASDEVLDVKFALLYFSQSRTSLIVDFSSPIWPKRLTNDDKAALKPGSTLNVRLANGCYYRVILCFIGIKEDCEKEQKKIDNRMAKQGVVTENLSFLEDSICTSEDQQDDVSTILHVLFMLKIVVHAYSGHVSERGTHESVDFIVQRSRKQHRFLL